jgi:hypothetical protein
MRKQLVISIATALSVLFFISEALAGGGDLTQIPDKVYEEIEIGDKKLCFVTDSRQCLMQVTCDAKRTPIPKDFTLAEFLKADYAKVTIENNACATFVIDIKFPGNPCVVSGGAVYCN